MEPIFFRDWAELGRAALIAVIAYTGFIILLRISGKRTLAKMNVFDFVFVVALGSILGETILIPEISASKGLTACATLILFQIMISWLTTRSSRIEKFINGEPTLLMHRGEFLTDAMKSQRVTEEEVIAAIRAHGLASGDTIEAVVLETDGTFSVVWRKVEESQSAIKELIPQVKNSRKEKAESREEE